MATAQGSGSSARPRVMVSGCFDMLHSGHVAFLEEAAEHGEVHVCVGSDRTVFDLKGRPTINSEQERKYLLESLRCVTRVYISRGSGILDFLPELDEIRPQIFFVNADGDTPAKRELMAARGIEYIVSSRKPREGLVARSTTSLRTLSEVPFRLDLAGGWLDQPMVSKHHPGAVVNCSLVPTDDYELRSGMSSSTRRTAQRLWGPRLPADDREKLAQIIFAVENPPGTKDVAGSQDAIGIVYPGLNRMDYDGAYWPTRITTTQDESVLQFLESHIKLVFTEPRPVEFDVLGDTRISAQHAADLARAADEFWQAVLDRNAPAAGKAMTASFDAQVAMFPRMRSPQIDAVLASDAARKALGHKITGAGGGGYVVLFTPDPVPNAIPIRIRREDGT